MTKKKDYPLWLCSSCAEEYAAGGFTVKFAEPKRMIVNQRCAFCGMAVPVYACRIEGRGRPKQSRGRK